MSNNVKKTLFCLLFLLLPSLSACGGENTKKKELKVGEPGNYKIYCIHNSGTKVVSEGYQASAVETKALVEELLERLSKPPEELGLKQAIPEGVSVTEIQLIKNIVILNFSETYRNVTGYNEVLRRACVVKTLCQIEGIDLVKFTVGDQPLMYSETTPVGYMKADDFIDNTRGETTYYQTVHLTLYYTDVHGDQLFAARHSVEFDGTISIERLILDQLSEGPLPEEKLMPVIPEGTLVNKVHSKDGICYVDFSKEFLQGIDGVSNQVIIYSIVNSLSEIGSVTKVRFSVDGSAVDFYREDIPLDLPIERKLEVIKNK